MIGRPPDLEQEKRAAPAEMALQSFHRKPSTEVSGLFLVLAVYSGTTQSASHNIISGGPL